MKSLHNVILAIGILMTAGGVAGAGYLYRQMKTENLMHASTGRVAIELAKRGSTKEATFTLYRPGVHVMYLSMINRSNANPLTISAFQGKVNVQILNPDGNSVLQKNITPGIFDLSMPDSVSRVPLDSLNVIDPTQHSWTIRTRTIQPDTAFSGTYCEVFVLPPQQYDIESYLTTNIVILIGMGGAVLGGFGLMVFSGYVRHKTQSR